MRACVPEGILYSEAIDIHEKNGKEELSFRNTDENPANQSKPAKLVNWGDGTTDEMCIGIYEWVPVDANSKPNVRKRDAP